VGEATDEPAREDARPTNGGRGLPALPTHPCPSVFKLINQSGMNSWRISFALQSKMATVRPSPNFGLPAEPGLK